MKRKLLVLALALTVVFGLCACGQTSLMMPNAREGAKKLASVENCHLVLRLTINPRLELYLDETGTVLKATGSNKDGKRLLAELDLTGLSYADAVNAILSGAAEQEFLKENANVQIDVLASTDGPLAYEETQQLQQAVTDYDEDLRSSVDQSDVVAANCGADLIEVEEADNGDVWYSYYSQMTLIREIRYAADGSYTEWVYQPWGIASLIDIAPDGARHEEHMTYEDGVLTCHQHITQQGNHIQTEESWYEDGCLARHIVQDSDGNYEETTYYSNGNQKTQKKSWADGGCGEYTFYANGNPETMQYTGTDGMVQEQSYYENGVCAFSKNVYPDGRVQEQSYYENGVCAFSKDVCPDGRVQEQSYHENGEVIYSKDVYPDGSRNEQRCTYDENGVLTYMKWFTQQGDDTDTEECWYENGCISRFLRQISDGYYEESTYYADGSTKTGKIVRPDGSGAESSYNENGVRIFYREVRTDGTVRVEHCYENGNLKFREETLPDGTVQEEHFHENGIRKIWKEVFSDGSSCLQEYNADGCRIHFVKTYANGDWEKEVCDSNGRTQTQEGSVGGEYYIIRYDENGQIIE